MLSCCERRVNEKRIDWSSSSYANCTLWRNNSRLYSEFMSFFEDILYWFFPLFQFFSFSISVFLSFLLSVCFLPSSVYCFLLNAEAADAIVVRRGKIFWCTGKLVALLVGMLSVTLLWFLGPKAFLQCTCTYSLVALLSGSVVVLSGRERNFMT